MSETTDAILAAVVQAAKAWAESPQGQKTIGEVKDMIVENAPGWEFAVLRGVGGFLHALEPHEVESMGFRRDGPG